ncbi:MAG: hypothetical protein IPG45_35155 [Deltaproteobacteria bacterium]|nr:hypothetical protein [Deltaproteobacteria bacterium]
MRHAWAGTLLLFAACTKAEPAPVERWAPGKTYASPAGPTHRGLLDRRGLIHAHSIWSHDACDDEPVKNGERDWACDADFRNGLCAVKHDFVMLTDHGSDFAITTMTEASLHRPERGDRLLEREGQVVGNWAACPDGRSALIIPGTETGFTPVGLEHHLGDTPEERKALYGEISAESAARLRAAGGLVLMAHTEDWTAQELIDLTVDGFEMYNLHANALKSAGTVLELVVLATERPAELPQSELIFLPLFSEDPRYLGTWGSVLARGYRPTTTMGTDCHQNSFPALLPDGERGDSYRRMMGWFSNHLLVRPTPDGNFDDRALKEALDAGRLYGVFEAMGYAEGFDYRAERSGRTAEMGDEVTLAEGPVLKVSRPTVFGLDPDRTPPELSLVILKAKEGGFDVVASGAEDLSYTPTEAGAYRAEVRMVPKHLREDLGSYARTQLQADRPWIYSNPIYVR